MPANSPETHQDASGATLTLDVDTYQGVGVRFEVPGIPRPKARARHGRTKTGRPITFSDAKTKSYENLVAMAAYEAMAGRQPFDGPLRCELVFCVPVPASWSKRKRDRALAGELHPSVRPDLDNFVKSIKDGLNSVVWTDDARVWWLLAEKRYARRPRVEIWVRP